MTEIRDYSSGPPWIFRGRAIYQLHLVKADVARRFIPKDLNLVHAFGYTLGGLYFAQYDSSPAGKFDELVALAGIVWNPPTSCAWAARVLVDSEEAREHGIREVGLPSTLASFSKAQVCSLEDKPKARRPFALGRTKGVFGGRTLVNVSEAVGGPLCQIRLPETLRKGQRLPRVKMTLPSFSGRTEAQPDLLCYGCDLSCGIRFVSPTKVLVLPSQAGNEESMRGSDNGGLAPNSSLSTSQFRKSLLDILLARPIVSMAFEDMQMVVKKPEAKQQGKMDRKCRP